MQTGAEAVKKSSCRAAAILLGLLSFFLLIGLISLGCLGFTQGKSQWEMETVTLQKLYNVTRERNQLQASYNNLTTERDQLQASYNNLTTERDQLQASYNNLTTERDQLQASYNNLTTERDQLLARYNSTVKERDQLRNSLEVMTKKKDELWALIQDCANWVVFNGSLYYVSSNKTSWQNSRQDCLQRGADLMIINSQEEQNFANQFKKSLWIGMTDSETEGSWKWVDGTPVTTRYWNNNEPNGGINENWGQISNYNSQNSWNDDSNSKLFFWICEKKVSP
ncbi:CD209 antigen-like [Archocentrus centrarchus]|uniref:CD209 antigen-like n=1 Tax=Archocentrus centrarchus TaxID=63155 RepID=UPI0011E9E9ED|nr:CD209 antigen-like [Archocentrus centrarchus]